MDMNAFGEIAKALDAYNASPQAQRVLDIGAMTVGGATLVKDGDGLEVTLEPVNEMRDRVYLSFTEDGQVEASKSGQWSREVSANDLPGCLSRAAGSINKLVEGVA